jgi:hypothetical protein
MMKQKKQTDGKAPHDSILDIQGTKLTYAEFQKTILDF